MEKYILLPVFLMILLVVAVSGCLSLEDEYENSILSFKIPENWTVVDATNLDILAGLKPVGTNTTLIDISTTDVSPQELVDGYIKKYSQKNSNFKILKNEPVTIDGEEGVRLIYKIGKNPEGQLNSPYYVSSVVAFSKNNYTYIISSVEVSNKDYITKVEPAMNKVTSTIKIKGYFT
ncbi:MAG: PsbP-related protein [Euryarchaeota archaeon]|nr:PsbP-related protein [Euryarchaeota archaeon]